MTPLEFRIIRDRIGISAESLSQHVRRKITADQIDAFARGDAPIPMDVEAALLALGACINVRVGASGQAVN